MISEALSDASIPVFANDTRFKGLQSKVEIMIVLLNAEKIQNHLCSSDSVEFFYFSNEK